MTGNARPAAGWSYGTARRLLLSVVSGDWGRGAGTVRARRSRWASRESGAAAVTLLAIAGSALSGCSGTTQPALGRLECPSGTAHRAVGVRASPSPSLLDQPLTIRVTGLPPGEMATLDLNSTDGEGSTWASSATYRADCGGVIDPGRTAAVGGSYSGVDRMGFIDMMATTAQQGSQTCAWDLLNPLPFTLTLLVRGAVVAATTFSRMMVANGVTVQDESLASTGFIGRFWLPPPNVLSHPAVLQIGGSEGGVSSPLVGALLASHGYPTLDIAYFKEPGLPARISNIPLDYFARALTWLRRQPKVDPRHVYTLGLSRGSEAALLLGVYFPGLVHGVIAASPSNVANCSYPGCYGPAWTLRGRPLPYTRIGNDPNPPDDPQAVIPVERIHGPIFLICGVFDQVWNSCTYARAIMARLDAKRDPYAHVLAVYAAAGHGVDLLVPYNPVGPGFRQEYRNLEGLTTLANYDAQARVWPRLLAFLARF